MHGVPPPPPPPPPVPPPPPPIPPPPAGGRGELADGRRRVPWGPGEGILVAVIAYVASQIIAAILIVATGSIGTCGPLELVGLIGSELGMAGTIVFWILVVKRARLATLGAPEQPLRDVGTGLLGGLALYGVALVTSVVVVALVTLVIGHSPQSPQQIDTCVRGPWLVIVGIAAVVFPPIGEETVFRGFVFQGLRTRFAFWPAALIDGVLFGMIHLPLWLLVPSLTVVGIGLAYIYNRRQSLLASMVAHATFNLVGIIFIAMQR